MNYLSSNLFYLRKKKGLRQNELYNHTGVSRTTWSNYENGLTEPSVEGLLKISNFFGISLDELIRDDLSAETGNLQNQSAGSARKKGKKVTQYEPDRSPLPVVNETDLSFVLKELKKLRQEVNTIKDSRKKK